MTTPSTENAQRRFIEALADLGNTDGGLVGFGMAVQVAIDITGRDQPELRHLWRRLKELAEAVDDDLKEAVHGD